MKHAAQQNVIIPLPPRLVRGHALCSHTNEFSCGCNEITHCHVSCVRFTYHTDHTYIHSGHHTPNSLHIRNHGVHRASRYCSSSSGLTLIRITALARISVATVNPWHGSESSVVMATIHMSSIVYCSQWHRQEEAVLHCIVACLKTIGCQCGQRHGSCVML